MHGHGYGGMGGGREGGFGGGWYACEKKTGVGCMSVVAGALPECEVDTVMTPNHTAFQVRGSG